MPEDALRKALLNAIIHRDYAIGAPIQIRVYPDRIRIWNPGELPERWTIAKLLKPHPSRPFNPGVANAFFRAGEIEAWGRGVQRIMEACREAGAPAPLIESQGGDIWIEFPFSARYRGIVPAEQRASGETSGETSGAKLPGMRGKIVRLMLGKTDITIPEIARRLKRNDRAIEMQINRLKADEIIKRIGPSKGGHWEVLP